jgi:hypothetical protein
MMSESTLLEEKSRKVTRPSTNHQESKDSSLRRDSEERVLRREIDLLDSRHKRKPKLSTIKSYPSTSRKEKPTTVKKKPQLKLLPLKLLPQLRLLPQSKHNQLRLLPQLKHNQSRPKLPPLSKLLQPRERNENLER